MTAHIRASANRNCLTAVLEGEAAKRPQLQVPPLADLVDRDRVSRFEHACIHLVAEIRYVTGARIVAALRQPVILAPIHISRLGV